MAGRYKSGPTGRLKPNQGYGPGGATHKEESSGFEGLVDPGPDTATVEPEAMKNPSYPSPLTMDSRVGGSHRTPDHAAQDGATRGHLPAASTQPWHAPARPETEGVKAASGADQASKGKKVTKAAAPWITAAEAGRLPD